MLYVVIDLTARVTPARAVAELEGLRFKRTEHRLKRYSRNGSMAEAVHEGPLRVMRIAAAAVIGESTLVDRRWTTLADFPWTSYMDTEALVLQHTTFITHRVSVVCETGLQGAGTDSVRIEWDFAKTRKGESDDAERVDWAVSRLWGGADVPVAASLTLRRLLRARDDGLKDAAAYGREDDEGAQGESGVRGQDADPAEADACGACQLPGRDPEELEGGSGVGDEDGDDGEDADDEDAD